MSIYSSCWFISDSGWSGVGKISSAKWVNNIFITEIILIFVASYKTLRKNNETQWRVLLCQDNALIYMKINKVL